MSQNAASSVDYKALEQERINKSKAALRQKLKDVSKNDLGRNGSLRRVILGLVVAEKYEQGKTELVNHIERKRVYPSFKGRVERFVAHATDLITAIETKRSFPGLASLSLSKQQEIIEKVLGHFEELKSTLRTIERAEKDVRLEDLRTTVWPVKIFAHCVVIMTVAAVYISLRNGAGESFIVVFEALVDDVATYMTHLLGW